MLKAGLASLALKVTLENPFKAFYTIQSSTLASLHIYVYIESEAILMLLFSEKVTSTKNSKLQPICLQWSRLMSLLNVASVGSGGFAQVNWPSESVTSKARHIPNAF